MSLPTVTVTGKFVHPDGTPMTGRVVFRLPVSMVDVNDNVIMPASVSTAALDGQGAFSATLVPSDAAGMVPTPVAYHVTEPGGRDYDLVIPSALPTVRLAELAPLDTAPTPSAAGEAFQQIVQRGQPNGYASLDSGGHVPTTQLPAADPATDAHVAATDPHGDRAYATATFVPQTAVGVSIATLVGGKVPSGQIPALQFVKSHVVANQAAMLALTGVNPGEDLAIRQDGAGTFLLTGSDPTQLASWTLLPAPTDAVTSVNGFNGAVVLNAAAVGADAAGAASAALVTATGRAAAFAIVLGA